MKKNPPKKSGLTPQYDSQREQNVLLEKIYSEVKTVAEGHSNLSRNINDIRETLDEHGSRFDRIEMVVSENRKDIKELKAGQVKLEAGQAKLEVSQEELKADVSGLKVDVSQLKTDVSQLKTGQERIGQKLDVVTIDHEQRIQKLEVVH